MTYLYDFLRPLINLLRSFSFQLTFTDFLFFPFLAVAIVLYFALPIRHRWLALLAASVAMYLSWAVVKFVVPLAEIFVAWGAAIFIEQQYAKLQAQLSSTEDKEKKKTLKAAVQKKCLAILWLAIVLMAGILISSKSLRILAVKFPSLPLASKFLGFVSPLGISYYTLSLIGYVADVYWKRYKAESNFFKLLLFALYFPKILQGPISSYAKIGKQLFEGHNFDYKRFCYGVQLMLWGYFKKLVLADRLAIIVSKVFGDVGGHSGSVLLVAAIFSCVAGYCDFSGCMDMGLGMSQIFGVDLERNFKRPFFVKSAADFWRRWHITLGGWFRDYVYMPLAASKPLLKLSGKVRKTFGKRASLAVLTIPTLGVVWFFTGLWHWSKAFMLWGFYWWLIIVVETTLAPEAKKLYSFLRIKTESRAFQIFQVLRTFALFVGSCFITTHRNLGIVTTLKQILFHFEAWNLFDGTLYKIGLDRPDLHLALLCTALLLWLGNLQEKGFFLRDAVSRQQIAVRWTIYYAAFFAVLIFGIYGAGYDAKSFVYMQF